MRAIIIIAASFHHVMTIEKMYKSVLLKRKKYTKTQWQTHRSINNRLITSTVKSTNYILKNN